MQNGDRISELIQKLWLTDRKWEIFVLSEEKADDNEEVKKLINYLVRVLRKELKTGDRTEIKEYLQEERLKRETAEKLIDNALEMLQFYSGFSLLRELETKDEITLKGLLAIIYQKYIVRYEPGYVQRMEVGKYSEEELMGIVSRITYLTDYYIVRSYTVKGMVDDLRDETGLSRENCEYWADLIEQNYQMLKMNYILEQMGRIENRIEQWGAE